MQKSSTIRQPATWKPRATGSGTKGCFAASWRRSLTPLGRSARCLRAGNFWGKTQQPMRRKRKSWPWQVAQLNTDEPAIYYLWLRTS
eukprot:1277530-Alexandrium_andersonii.AAC.1